MSSVSQHALALPVESPADIRADLVAHAHLPIPLRVTLHSVGLANYRVPAYASLSDYPDLDLTVCYSQTPWIRNARPEGFKGVPARMYRVSRHPLLLYVPERFRSTRKAPNQPHVLVFPWDLRYPLLVPSIIRAHRNGIGVVLWGHGYSKRDNRVKRWLRDRVARMADAVIVYYPHSRDRLLKLGFEPSRVYAAPNAIDQTPIRDQRAQLEADPASLERFRTERNILGDPLLLFVARLMPDRYLEVLLDALPEIARTHPRIQLAVVGDGEADLRRLRSHAHNLGVTELDPAGNVLTPGADGRGRVRFVPATYSEAELAPWFLSAKAMVFPGALGLTVLHAFGYGLPVIASDQPGLHGPEFASLEHGVNGLLFRAFDRGDLARSVRRLLDEPGLHQRLSTQATASVAENYTIPRMAQGLHDAIVAAARRRVGTNSASPVGTAHSHS